MSNDRQNQFLRDTFLIKQPQDNLGASILLGSSDLGVRENSGRNGARFAGEAILYQLGRFNLHQNFLNKKNIYINELCNKTSQINLKQCQESIISSLNNNISSLMKAPIIHIGGGHDHIYPLVSSIEQKTNKKIVILNLDAHLDTRVGDPNSGTPFRDIDLACSNQITLIQYGIQQISNSSQTMTPLKNIDQKIIYMNEINQRTKQQNQVDSELIKFLDSQLSQETVFIISLDCDVLDGAFFTGVSAVNPYGLSTQYVRSLLQELKKLTALNTILGIYEYNPVYDNLSCYGSKYLAELIYQFLE